VPPQFEAYARLVVHASAEAEDGRYYNKTLAQLDQVTFVRDRAGDPSDNEGAKYEDSNQNSSMTNPGENDASEETPDSPMIPPSKTQHQLDIEKEWDLHRPFKKRQEQTDSDESDHESIDWRKPKDTEIDEEVRVNFRQASQLPATGGERQPRQRAGRSSSASCPRRASRGTLAET